MIYSITLNPSIDLSGEVNELVLDEKNYVNHETFTAGGKSVNAGIIGGSLPLGIDYSFIEDLILKAKKSKTYCIVDMAGNYLKKIIHLRPDFIKPNLTELQMMIGKKVNTIIEILPLTKELLKLVPYICISSLEGGAILVTKNEVWFGQLPKIKIYSSVGAGDSMVGVIAYLCSTNSKASSAELLKLCLAASCATLSQKGVTLSQRDSILKCRSKIILKKIS